jgi:hypothetical protein
MFQTKSGIWFSGRIACSLFFIGEADESRKNRLDHLEMKLGIILNTNPIIKSKGICANLKLLK